VSNVKVFSTALLMGTALLLTACGASPSPTAPAMRAAAAAKVRNLPALDGALTANRVLTFTHAAARQLDAKAAFTGLVGTMIGAEGKPTGKGTWTAQYMGSEVAQKGPKNPYANKVLRRITITVNAEGETTSVVTEETGMPLGLSFLDAPLPELDSSDVLKIVRRERPAGSHFPVEKMALCGHPRDYQLMLWKIGTVTQSGERPITVNANTGAIVTTPY
jgi:hypothetical protein